MLDLTLATEFVPGTNVKGEVAGANWLFLLPSLELGRVACLGPAAPATLAALARVADDVVVIGAGAEVARQIDEAARKYQLANLRQVDSVAALADSSVGLALVGADGKRRLDDGLVAEMQRILGPEGLVYFEHKGNLERGQAIRRASASFGPTQRFWLTPIGGEAHTAIPAQDQATRRYFLRHGLTSRSIDLGKLKRAVRGSLPDRPRGGAVSQSNGSTHLARDVARRGWKGRAKRAMRTTAASLYNSAQAALDEAEQRLGQSALFGGVASRYGVLASRSLADLTEQPPRYLRELARAGGVNIDHHRWGLSARGEYSSRKVLVFLFNPADESPEYIVKMTRDAALNPRLENEHSALKLLAERGIGDRETLPRVAFFGHHRGLAVLGETIVDGAPFERRSSGASECGYARDAIAWLTELGARTADRTAASALEVAEGLEVLFRRFAEIYRLAPAHHAFLKAQIEIIAQSRAAFPLVFQHGDPGTWNAMVAPSGRAAFLDWEASEPQGMPLWDLLYFVRTYGAWSMRAATSGDPTKGFSTQFLARTPFQTLLVGSTARYCAAVGLSQQFVEPLFYTCWMHRALKESTRLAAGALDGGHYISLLRASIERRDDLSPLFESAETI
jgi:hypothetical protein